MTSSRTYEKTHHWLTFVFPAHKVPHHVWILLGEAQSKFEHIAGVPLKPATAKRLHNLYLAKGALATTAIEGNTLSEEEALKRVEGKLTLPPSREYLGKEIDNIVGACNEILRAAMADGPVRLVPDAIKGFNRAALLGLAVAPEVEPGEVRKHSVTVARYRGAPAEDCDYLLERLCEWLSEDWSALGGSGAIVAVLKAVLAHLYLAWIHPFGDGNGRTARLLEFRLLIDAGIATPAAHLLSNHYNQTRTEYYRQLDAASKSGGDVIPFVRYAVQGLVDGLRAQLEEIRFQQWDVAWVNYVHDRFRDKKSPAQSRQRDLVLDLSESPEDVPVQKLSQVSPRVSAAYASKTSRTLLRDVAFLVNLGLIERTEKGYRAKKERILAFLPLGVGEPKQQD